MHCSSTEEPDVVPLAPAPLDPGTDAMPLSAGLDGSSLVVGVGVVEVETPPVSASIRSDRIDSHFFFAEKMLSVETQ